MNYFCSIYLSYRFFNDVERCTGWIAFLFCSVLDDRHLYLIDHISASCDFSFCVGTRINHTLVVWVNTAPLLTSFPSSSRPAVGISTGSAHSTRQSLGGSFGLQTVQILIQWHVMTSVKSCPLPRRLHLTANTAIKSGSKITNAKNECALMAINVLTKCKSWRPVKHYRHN